MLSGSKQKYWFSLLFHNQKDKMIIYTESTTSTMCTWRTFSFFKLILSLKSFKMLGVIARFKLKQSNYLKFHLDLFSLCQFPYYHYRKQKQLRYTIQFERTLLSIYFLVINVRNKILYLFILKSFDHNLSLWRLAPEILVISIIKKRLWYKHEDLTCSFFFICDLYVTCDFEIWGPKQ